MPKGGGLITGIISSGIGAYAAKKSSSMTSLLWTVLKYSAVVVGLYVAFVLVMNAIGRPVENFVPVAPSEEQDQKVTTPAGNVITY